MLRWGRTRRRLLFSEAGAVSGVLDAGDWVGDCADALSAYGDGGAERAECECGATERGDASGVQLYAWVDCAAGVSGAGGGSGDEGCELGGAAAVSEDVSGVVCGVLPGGGGDWCAGAGGDYVDCGFESVYAESVWGGGAAEDDCRRRSRGWRRWCRWW